MDDYADYVRNLDFDSAYIERAKRVTQSAVRFFHRLLVQQSAHGLCVDTSGILGRFLEKQGVWNYAVKGGLTLNFAHHTGQPQTFFAPVFAMGHVRPGQTATGHAWVVAPPYKIVDATVSQQRYAHGQGRFVPEIVLAESVTPGGARTIEDWVDVDLMAQFQRQYRRPMRLRDLPALISQEAIDYANKWDVVQVDFPDVTLKYCPTGVMAGDMPLEQAKNLRLSGLDPFGLYQKWVREEGPF